MKKMNKKILMSLSVFATPFVVESFSENVASANQYTLTENVKVYGTSQNAAKQTDSNKTYTKGTYYVYKKHNGMINISKTPGKAGAWINPTTNKEVTPAATSTSTESKSQNTASTSTIPKIKTGTYTLNNDVNVYSNAVLAKSQKGSKARYKSGNYFVFKEFNGMMNISRVSGKAGAWINPVENKVITANDKPTSQNNNSNTVTQNNTVTLRPGATYSLNKQVKIYSSAVEAEKNSANTKNTYNQGQYYIYKVHNGMINISRVKGRAGAWINPKEAGTSEIVTENTEVPTTSVSTRTPINVGNLGKYSDKRFSWSWNYPSPEALKILKANNGLYKYNTTNKELYLTFDNGYEEGYTSKILDILKNNNVKVVFFVTGEYIRDNLNLVKRMEAEGHVVANHTLRHYDASKVNAWTVTKDIKDWENSYVKYMKKSPETNLYRPATGTFSERTVKGAASHGYKLVQWSYAHRDWEVNNQPPVNTARNNLIKYSKPGDIVLLHSISRTNRDLLDGYIKEMKSRGYDFKLVK
ncbi:MAG: polysaccharide deacetylase family protein [Gemella sp.]|nr:polysaccharide deacetylase family protein [Gemella sp.]